MSQNSSFFLLSDINLTYAQLFFFGMKKKFAAFGVVKALLQSDFMPAVFFRIAFFGAVLKSMNEEYHIAVFVKRPKVVKQF